MCKGSWRVCRRTLSLAFLLCSAGSGCLVSSVNMTLCSCVLGYSETPHEKSISLASPHCYQSVLGAMFPHLFTQQLGSVHKMH